METTEFILFEKNVFKCSFVVPLFDIEFKVLLSPNLLNVGPWIQEQYEGLTLPPQVLAQNGYSFTALNEQTGLSETFCLIKTEDSNYPVDKFNVRLVEQAVLISVIIIEQLGMHMSAELSTIQGALVSTVLRSLQEIIDDWNLQFLSL